MTQYRIETPIQTAPVLGRECGSCYACCVWLGIEELGKYTGQVCKHLSGGADPSKRCSIYPTRPTACSGYECMWRSGWGVDNLRPSECGILITPYQSESKPGHAAITVHVFDQAKAEATISITDLIAQLFAMPLVSEIRLVNIQHKKALFFSEGKIYRCKILPPDGYESLIFATEDPPIGTYQTMEEPAPASHQP